MYSPKRTVSTVDPSTLNTRPLASLSLKDYFVGRKSGIRNPGTASPWVGLRPARVSRTLRAWIFP